MPAQAQSTHDGHTSKGDFSRLVKALELRDERVDSLQRGISLDEKTTGPFVQQKSTDALLHYC